MSGFKNARVVDLYDSQLRCVLSYAEGWAEGWTEDVYEQEHFPHIRGKDLYRIARIFGVNTSLYDEIDREVKYTPDKDGNRKRTTTPVRPDDIIVPVYSGELKKIFCHELKVAVIDGGSIEVDFVLDQNDDTRFRDRFTYHGKYLIEWVVDQDQAGMNDE